MIKHNYTSEGHQFKNSASWDVSFSFRASDTGAGKISGRQQPERPSKGTACDKSTQEQELGPEQEAQHEAQQEWKQKTRTEEGCKELRDTAESKTGPCPF